MRCAKRFLRCSHRKDWEATSATFGRKDDLSRLEDDMIALQFTVTQVNERSEKS